MKSDHFKANENKTSDLDTLKELSCMEVLNNV